MKLNRFSPVPVFLVILCASAAIRFVDLPSTETALSTQVPVLQQSRLDGPLAPEKATESFQLEPGLRIELVAAEPLVASPVALAFDERGRLFVAENRGYPTGPGEGQPPAGRIALLEDTDGDGRMDKRTEFA